MFGNYYNGGKESINIRGVMVKIWQIYSKDMPSIYQRNATNSWQLPKANICQRYIVIAAPISAVTAQVSCYSCQSCTAVGRPI